MAATAKGKAIEPEIELFSSTSPTFAICPWYSIIAMGGQNLYCRFTQAIPRAVYSGEMLGRPSVDQPGTKVGKNSGVPYRLCGQYVKEPEVAIYEPVRACALPS